MAASDQNPYEDTLLIYDTAQEILSRDEFETLKKAIEARMKEVPNIDSKPDMRSIMNSILPPKLYIENGRFMKKNISTEKTSATHITFLQSSLDTMLLSRQARESGICPIREELHNQCLDEIIRQVTLDLPERGLILMRVRDELNMTIDAYKQLYEGSLSYTVKKQLQATKGIDELQERIRLLEDRKAELEKKVKYIVVNRIEGGDLGEES